MYTFSAVFFSEPATHFPDDRLQCYSNDGYDAAAKSMMAASNWLTGVGMIDAFINDPGPKNLQV